MENIDEKQTDGGNSEAESELGTGLPSSIAELGSRIQDICVRVGWAKCVLASGKSVKQLRRYAKGDDVPISALVGIAKVGGVSLDWLITGEGEMRPTQAPPDKAALGMAENLTEDLLGRIVEGITMVYREEGGRLAPRNLGQMAARLYSDLVAAYDVPEERVIGLKGELAKLRRELRTVPAADTGSGKRLA